MNMTGIRVVGGRQANLEFQPEGCMALVEAATERGSTEADRGPHTAGPERDRRLLEHLPTVRYIARKIHARLPQHVEMEDLVSAGTMGLIDAFHKFDHSRHVQFNSYAQFRIKGAILDHLRELDWGPRELRRKGRAIEEATRTLTQQLGRAPQEQEIAEQMGRKLVAYQQLLGELKGLEIGSLHAVHDEGSSEEEIATVAGPEDNPELAVLQQERRERLVEAIEELPEKERLVLTLYYYEELSMKEIGEVLGVVESRVSQIRSAAIARLRVGMANSQRGGARPSGRRKPPMRAYEEMERMMA